MSFYKYIGFYSHDFKMWISNYASFSSYGYSFAYNYTLKPIAVFSDSCVAKSVDIIWLFYLVGLVLH